MVLRLIWPTPRQQGSVCLLSLASFNWERGGAKYIFKGETCQKSGGFHQLERGLRGGRGDARNSDFADLALCSSAACRFSSEGRTTPFGCLLLMKTTRFLAGPPDICVHLEIGGARDESPGPCLMARALLRRPLATSPRLTYRSAYGKSFGRHPSCSSLLRRLPWGDPRPVPHSHPCLSLCTIPVGKHWASVRTLLALAPA